MMFDRVVIRWIITFIFSTTFPEYFDILLRFFVFEPIIAHVHGFGTSLYDCVSEDNNHALLFI